MRLRNLCLLAGLSLLFFACSDKDLSDGASSEESASYESYVNLTIRLPFSYSNANAKAATRAFSSFSDGTADEYAVKDTRILIFKKGTSDDDEGSYTFFDEPTPTVTEWIKDNSTDEVTTQATFSAKINQKVMEGYQLYALVLLNADQNAVPTPTSGTTFSDFSKGLGSDGKYGTACDLTDNTTNHAYAEGTVLGYADTAGVNIRKYIAQLKPTTTNSSTTSAKRNPFTRGTDEAEAGSGEDWTAPEVTKFVMSNAPNSYSASKSQDPTVLVGPLTLTFKPGTPTATIYVERSAVKVTVTNPSKKYKLASNDSVTVTPLAWGLTNTNKYMYLVHQVDGLSSSYSDIWSVDRFKGTTINGINSGANFRRTNWASDPNYSKSLTTPDACAGQVHIADTAEIRQPFTTDTKEYPLYCAENTFDINHMMKGQTTAVVIKARMTFPYHRTNAGDDDVAANPVPSHVPMPGLPHPTTPTSI